MPRVRGCMRGEGLAAWGAKAACMAFYCMALGSCRLHAFYSCMRDSG